EVAALDALLAHPDETGIEGQVVACGARAKDDHAAAFHHETGNRKGLLAGMLEDEIDIVALACNAPDRLAKLAHLFHVLVVAGNVVDIGKRTPAVEVVAVYDTLGAELHHEISFRIIGDYADRIGARGGDELHRHRSDSPGRAPDQHVVARSQDVRAM